MPEFGSLAWRTTCWFAKPLLVAVAVVDTPSPKIHRSCIVSKMTGLMLSVATWVEYAGIRTGAEGDAMVNWSATVAATLPCGV